MKLFSIVGLVILIGTINLFLYRLNENFLTSLLVLNITLCIYFYTLSSLSLSTPPLIVLTGMLILYIGWMGYLTYKTWFEEYDTSDVVNSSKLYWIYLPVIYFGIFIIMFVWALWIVNSDEVRRSEFLKRRKPDTNTSTNSRKPIIGGEPTNKSLIGEFDEQTAHD